MILKINLFFIILNYSYCSFNENLINKKPNNFLRKLCCCFKKKNPLEQEEEEAQDKAFIYSTSDIKNNKLTFSSQNNETSNSDSKLVVPNSK
jgi:hypothetical protein